VSDSDLGERTEEATPEKIRKAREQGQFPRSRDGGAVAASAGVLLCVLIFGSSFVHAIHEYALRCFGNSEALLGGDPTRVLTEFGGVVLFLLFPTALAATLGALAIGLAESGFMFRTEITEFKWERLDPIRKLGQLFSPKQGAINVTLALLRVIAIGAVTFLVLRSEFPNLSKLVRTDLTTGITLVLEITLRLVAWSILALSVMSLLDFGHSWLKTKRELMMTQQELKEEVHQQEGDPKVKGRLRARAREIIRRGLAKELRRADVVIANPTHVAVAIRYRPHEGAPVVLARGYDEIALYVRKLAEEYGIPIVENRPLARSLAAKAKVGKMIPEDLYQAVAQVLAFVYRNRGRALPTA